MSAFPPVLLAERRKLLALRSTRITLVLSTILAVALSLGVALAVGITWSSWSDAERADLVDGGAYEMLGMALVGSIVTAIFFVVLGATAATSEYGAGLIRLTLAATPRRGLVLAAKALVVYLVIAGTSAVQAVAMIAATRITLDSYDVPAGSIDLAAVATVVLSCLLAPVLPLIALCLGFVLRSTAGAITATLGLVFVPGIIGALLPAWWADHVLIYEPVAASDALIFGHLGGFDAALTQPAAAVVLVGWAAVLVAAAWGLLERRDA